MATVVGESAALASISVKALFGWHFVELGESAWIVHSALLSLVVGLGITAPSTKGSNRGSNAARSGPGVEADVGHLDPVALVGVLEGVRARQRVRGELD